MAVSISTDLTVQVLDDPNKVKLTDRQQQLHAAIQKGEPKCLGVSIFTSVCVCLATVFFFGKLLSVKLYVTLP